MDILKGLAGRIDLKNSDEKKYYVLLAIWMLALIFFEIVLYFSVIQPLVKDGRIMDLEKRYTNKTPVILTDYEVYDQMVKSEKPLAGIALYLGTPNRIFESGVITVRLYDGETKELLEIATLDLEGIADSTYAKVSFSKTYDTKSDLYLVSMTAEIPEEEGECAVWQTQTKDDFFKQHMSVNGEKVKGYLDIIPMYSMDFLAGFYWAVAIGLCLFTCEGFWILKKSTKIEHAFVVLSICFGFMYMLVCLPYNIPDSRTHITNTLATATAWEQGQWSVGNNDYGQIRKEEKMRVFTDGRPTAEQYYYVTETIFDAAEFNGYSKIELPSAYTYSHEYIPQILGVLLARSLNMSQTGTLYTAEMVSLLFYTAIGYLTISISPYKTLFTVLALSCAYLRVNVSFSYDSMINALSMLIIAYILHLAHTSKKVSRKDIAIVTALILALAPCKVVYALLALLILLIPNRNFDKKRQKYVWLVCLGLASIFVILLTTGGYFQSTFKETDTIVSPWGEDAYSFSLMFSMPWEFIRITIVSIVDNFAGVILGAVGDVAHSGVSLTTKIGFALIAFLAIAGNQEKSVIKYEKWLYTLIFFGVMCLSYGASLRWTAIGSYTYQGMQPRYLTPVLPLFFLLFRGVLPKKIDDKLLIILMMCLNAYVILNTFVYVVW